MVWVVVLLGKHYNFSVEVGRHHTYHQTYIVVSLGESLITDTACSISHQVDPWRSDMNCGQRHPVFYLSIYYHLGEKTWLGPGIRDAANFSADDRLMIGRVILLGINVAGEWRVGVLRTH